MHKKVFINIKNKNVTIYYIWLLRLQARLDLGLGTASS